MGSIVNCGAVVDHHSIVEYFGHLSVNACMAGGTVLGRGAWMQVGAALGYGVKFPSGVTLDPSESVDSKTNKYKNDQRIQFKLWDSGLWVFHIMGKTIISTLSRFAAPALALPRAVNRCVVLVTEAEIAKTSAAIEKVMALAGK